MWESTKNENEDLKLEIQSLRSELNQKENETNRIVATIPTSNRYGILDSPNSTNNYVAIDIEDPHSSLDNENTEAGKASAHPLYVDDESSTWYSLQTHWYGKITYLNR